MIKFLKKVISTAIFCAMPVVGLAFQNEPIGFRDLYWGETLEEVKQGREVQYFDYLPKANSVMYSVQLNPDESKTLSRVPIAGESFFAVFWNDKLWRITLFCKGEDAFSSLKNAMIQVYGRPEGSEWDRCWWIGETTCLAVEKDKQVEGAARISLLSSKIMMDLSKEQASQGW